MKCFQVAKVLIHRPLLEVVVIMKKFKRSRKGCTGHVEGRQVGKGLRHSHARGSIDEKRGAQSCHAAWVGRAGSLGKNTGWRNVARSCRTQKPFLNG